MAGSGTVSNGGAADILLTGGRMHLGSAARGPADWLAVTGGRIAAFGRGRPPGGVTGAATRVIDVRGGLVVPGFQDAHVHPIHGGIAALTCELHDLPGVEAYTRTVAQYAREHP